MKELNADYFTQIKEALVMDAQVDLLEYKLYDPLPVAKIDKLLNNHQIISPMLKSFYSFTDGWRICWLYRDNPEYEELKSKFLSLLDDAYRWQDDYLYFNGIIHILPLADCLSNNGQNLWWYPQEPTFSLQFMGHSYDSLAFKKRIRLWDVFSKFYSIALLLEEPKDMPIVVLGQDHEADFHSAPPTDISTYFKLLFDSRGEVKERLSAFMIS